jgi:hypothetical protein
MRRLFPAATDDFPAEGRTIPCAGDKTFPAPALREIRAVYRDALKMRRE